MAGGDGRLGIRIGASGERYISRLDKGQRGYEVRTPHPGNSGEQARQTFASVTERLLSQARARVIAPLRTYMGARCPHAPCIRCSRITVRLKPRVFAAKSRRCESTCAGAPARTA